MNTNRLKIISEFLTEQMNHWLLFPLVLTVKGLIRGVFGIGEPNALLWFACSLIPLVFFLFRRRITHLIPLVLLHLGAVALCLLLASSLSPGGNLPDKVFCVVCVSGYALYSLILRLKHDSLYSDIMPLPAGIVLSAACIWLQHSKGAGKWDSYYYFSLILGIALYLIIFYMDRYLDFLSLNKSSAGFLPAREMFHSGMGLVLGYTLLGVFVLFVSSQFEWLADILQPLKNLLFRFLRFLFSFIPDPEPEGEPLVQETPPPRDMGDLMLPRDAKTFWLWEVLEVIVIIAFTGAVLFGAAVLIVRLARLIRKYLVLRMHGKSAVLEDAMDLREKCGLEKSVSRKKQHLSGFLSSRERIRRLYQKKLLSSRAQLQEADRSRLDIYTAREWERKLETDGMAEIYERARYSERDVTNADVLRMREACRRGR